MGFSFFVVCSIFAIRQFNVVVHPDGRPSGCRKHNGLLCSHDVLLIRSTTVLAVHATAPYPPSLAEGRSRARPVRELPNSARSDKNHYRAPQGRPYVLATSRGRPVWDGGSCNSTAIKTFRPGKAGFMKM